MAQLIHAAGKKLSALSAFTRYFLASLGLLALVNIGLGYWLYQELVLDRDEQTLEEAARAVVQGQAKHMSGLLRQLQAQMQEASTNSSLQEALKAEDPARLESIAQQLGANIEGLHQLYISSTDIGAQASLPLSFAELDLLRRAARGESALPEAGRVENDWRVSLVQEITDPETEGALGFLLLSVSLDRVLPVSLDGSMELLQRLPNQQLQLVLRRGIGTDTAPTTEARVANSAFTLRFTPSDMLIASARASRLPFLASLLLSSLLSLGLAYFAARRLSRISAKRTLTQEAESKDEVLEHLLSLEQQQQRGSSGSTAAVAAKASGQEEDLVDSQDSPAQSRFPHHIFRAYDIRGEAHTELTAELVMQIGKAVGSEALAMGRTQLAVARDGRLHSADISEQLVAGILSTGCGVTNIGLGPTPLLYFACHELEGVDSGVMVTASHNPSSDNGFKIVMGQEALHGEGIQKIRQRIEARDFKKGKGEEASLSLEDQYIERIFSDLFLSGEPRIVIDAGNGAAGQLAPRLFEALGCQVIPLFCDIDGNFPNHDPDPSVAANLEALVASVQEHNAELGLAFDGDGDRVVLVSSSGKIVPSDQLLMMLAKDIVARNPGADVLFDVKCSRALGGVISAYGGRPLMWKSGHSHMKAKMRETGALLGGEYSGHIFIKERWYGFDDGLYAAARILEIMSLREQDLDRILESFPVPPSTPEIKLPVPEADKFALVDKLIAQGDFGSGRATTIDGLRVDFAKGWGLVRPSNTSPALTLRFEGDSKDDLNKIVALFKRELAKLDPDLVLNF